MNSRNGSFGLACGLILLPVALASAGHLTFGTTLLETGWLLVLFTLLSAYCEFRALYIFETNFSNTRDIFWILKFPIGLFAATLLVISLWIFVWKAVPLFISELSTIFVK